MESRCHAPWAYWLADDAVWAIGNRRFAMKLGARHNDLAACEAALCPQDAASLSGEALEDETSDAVLAELAKAIAHPARVRILRLLARKEGCVCGEIVEEVGLAQSTVSQHLKTMKSAGLLQGEVDGPRVCYCIRAQSLARLKALVAGL